MICSNLQNRRGAPFRGWRPHPPRREGAPQRKQLGMICGIGARDQVSDKPLAGRDLSLRRRARSDHEGPHRSDLSSPRFAHTSRPKKKPAPAHAQERAFDSETRRLIGPPTLLFDLLRPPTALDTRPRRRSTVMEEQTHQATKNLQKSESRLLPRNRLLKAIELLTEHA